jgi:anti-sigma regulatory factor (Ser/Thr protein kinase)
MSTRRQVAEVRASLPATPESVARARALLGELLDDADVDWTRRRAGLLVASELVTNAIRHGSADGDEVGIVYEIKGSRLCICVSDAARGSSVPVQLSTDEQRLTGRGLQLVAQLADWSERIVNGRREVRAEILLF